MAADISPSAPGAGRVAAFFDLGQTIMARSTVIAYRRPFSAEGLITPKGIMAFGLTAAAMAINNRDDDALHATRSRLAQLVAGWPVSTVQRIAQETVEAVISPWVYAEARQLITHHHAAGHEVIIVSAAPSVTVQPIADYLGVEHVIATELGVDEGRFSGTVSFFCSGSEKERAIREIAAQRGYDLSRCYAYSDAISDLPMLECVGHPQVTNPDRALRKVAVANAWPIHTFRHPVPLIPQEHQRTAGAIGALVALLASAAVGTWCWLRHLDKMSPTRRIRRRLKRKVRRQLRHSVRRASRAMRRRQTIMDRLMGSLR